MLCHFFLFSSLATTMSCFLDGCACPISAESSSISGWFWIPKLLISNCWKQIRRFLILELGLRFLRILMNLFPCQYLVFHPLLFSTCLKMWVNVVPLLFFTDSSAYCCVLEKQFLQLTNFVYLPKPLQGLLWTCCMFIFLASNRVMNRCLCALEPSLHLTVAQYFIHPK